MSRETEGDNPAEEELPDEQRTPAATGWIASLRARFGLQAEQPTLRQTIEEALSEDPSSAADISLEERDMILRMLEFGASSVEDVMVPRTDIIALDESQSLHELLLTFEEAGVSRIPVFAGTLDEPRGMIHIKDLFRWLMARAAGRAKDAPKLGPASPKGVALPEIIPDKSALARAGDLDIARIDLSRSIRSTKLRRTVLFVPSSMPAVTLLKRMRTTRIHMALVVDEFGGTDGLVTIEDLVEQIVGDIEDEHDEEEVDLIVIDAGHGLVASGRTPVDELEKELGLKLLDTDEEDEIDTVGGLVVSIAGYVPARGETVRHPSGVAFEVLEADTRRVQKLKVVRPVTEKTESAKPTPTEATGKA